jgi:hypothetical protein
VLNVTKSGLPPGAHFRPASHLPTS